MNILVLSAGTRNKIIRYFKQALQGKGSVIATDMSPLAPALYEADRHYIVPAMTSPDYLSVILDICQKESVDGVLSLIDPELSLLAEHASDFASIGVAVIGSSYELCERSLDKFQMYQWLTAHQYSCAASYVTDEDFRSALDRGEICFPVFVKPARGSASIAVSQAHDLETASLLFRQGEHMMIQEYLRGQEIGADVYIDLISGEVVSIFTKKKLKMRAGETDKAVSFLDPKLFQFIEQFVKEAGFRGQIDIDLFEKDGTYYISEVNPRFGGGYPHAYECGCDHMSLIINNLNGLANPRTIGTYEPGIYMMKYSDVAIKKMTTE